MSNLKIKPSFGLGMLAIIGLLMSTGASAEDAKPVLDAGNTSWMLTSTRFGSVDDHSRRCSVLRWYGSS